MKKRKFTRFFVLYIFVIAFFLLCAGRLIYLQAITASDARKTIEATLSLSRRDPAPRGEICDRNKTVLAGNRKGYFVMINKGNDVQLAQTVKNLAAYEGISYQDLLIRMQEKNFSKNNPFVFSEDAPYDLVIKIKEFPEKYPCAKVTTRPVRDYPYPETAAHLLGRCGLISREEYEKNPDYKRDDYIGKQGAERAFEEILRGVDGTTPSEKYIQGEVRTFAESVAPTPGHNVILTIDLPFQQKCEEALASTIKQAGASGGAAVVCDVHSGEILAIASYPTYNIENFGKNYTRLSKDKNKPFFNRSISGLYAPGSTFKPITAIAAMESGKLSPSEKMKTTGEYKYFNHTFRCNIFRTTGKTHGTIDVSRALGVSCNWFFYELGKRTGIDEIYKTAHAFGLDSPTGIELSAEEATGIAATPENRKARNQHWYAGDTLQSAIGQSDNMFTPIALANYTAAMANGGTLYSMHILKATESPEGEISFTHPQVINKINMQKSTQDAIRKGMLDVTKAGTAAEIFKGFDVAVAGKTGSAQTGRSTNGLFIGYAPFDEPQIALCVVIEGAPSGNTAAAAAKDILAFYFDTEKEGNENDYNEGNPQGDNDNNR